ncbi:hypothetical protein [Mogibacterium pumilum]|uniref:Uncharacterized protein n=1 Tax=Mogibacterium pumilum TaxID=86332 RepID=A0A223AQN7_9FIRM|nr:hypothetical protein [Mogibacterium pumilum]ASS37267.1 hypothetical protein AXF17_01440 [Mogibacterium pumilum]
MKKILIATITIILGIYMCIIFICADLYIDHNIRKYSVYYAHHMEHKEGTHPEMAMALENMDVIYKPNKKNIRYREDGGYTIYNTFTNSEQVIISCNPGEKKLRYIYYNVVDKSYFFNETFSLTNIYNRSIGEYEKDVSTIDQEDLYKEIYNNFGFLVEANVNRKPLINMQKEFNKKYYKRFN